MPSLSLSGNQHILDDNGIFVTKIIKGGVADQEGRIDVGDRVLSVNGQNMVDIDHEDAVGILKATGQEVTLVIEKNAIPQDVTVTTEEEKVREREREGGREGGREGERVREREREREGEIYICAHAHISSCCPFLSLFQAKVLSLLLQAPGDRELVDKPRIITLQRPEGVGLGFNIIGGEEEVGIFISVISKEGVAAENGQLRVGDMILEVRIGGRGQFTVATMTTGEWAESGDVVT